MRVERACAFLHFSPPHGLALLESGDRIELVSAPDCGPLIARFLEKLAPEPVSQAALEVLSIVAYEQPVTRAEIRQIRGTDSSGIIETLLARGLIDDDPRFGGRGRRAFLVITADFLRALGLGSLAGPAPASIAGPSTVTYVGQNSEPAARRICVRQRRLSGAHLVNQSRPAGD